MRLRVWPLCTPTMRMHTTLAHHFLGHVLWVVLLDVVVELDSLVLLVLSLPLLGVNDSEAQLDDVKPLVLIHIDHLHLQAQVFHKEVVL